KRRSFKTGVPEILTARAGCLVADRGARLVVGTGFLRTAILARHRIISRELAIRCRNDANGAPGVVPPAVRVREFLATILHAVHLILESGAVTLLDDAGSDKHKQVALGPDVQLLLEEVTEERDVTQDRHLGPALGHFVLQEAANCERVTAAD